MAANKAAKKITQAREVVFTLTKRAAGGQGVARDRGSVSQQSVIAANKGDER
jgi:hypothetical protein